MPKTLQYATVRPKSAVLIFRKQLVYKVNPGGNNLSGNALECVYLTFRANSIYQIFQQTGSVNHTGVWMSQNALEYSPGVNCNADGYDNWKTRFQHFTVLGSKCQATYEPQSRNQPDGLSPAEQHAYNESDSNQSIFFVHKAGSTGIINATSTMATIGTDPYLQKSSVYVETGSAGRPARVTSKYSTKRFEGVKDVMDNTTLRGVLDSGITSPAQPVERSYFNVGIIPTIHAAGAHQCAGVMRINLEYICKLTEPTQTNIPSLGMLNMGTQTVGGVRADVIV